MMIFLVLIILTVMPYVFLALIKKGITRKKFSLITSLFFGSLLFILSILYVDKHAIAIGLFMFISMIVGIYPTIYLLFPKLQKKVLSK